MADLVAQIPPQSNSAATELQVEGMTCANCARHVTEAIQGVPGVARVEVSLQTGRALVHWRSGSGVQTGAVLEALKKEGYPSKPVSGAENSKSLLALSWKTTVWIGLIATAPMMVGEWVFGLGHEAWFRWSSFILATIVQIVCGSRFYKGAWVQAKAGASNMDTLVAIGSSTAYIYSLWGLLAGFPGHLYFMEGAGIISLVSLGHYFEARASERAAGSLKQLLQLTPLTILKIEKDGLEKEVSVASLLHGDFVRLRAGDRVPTDGELVEGRVSIDESTLTGESMPVEKEPGAKMFAGTLVLDSSVKMRVTGTGEETALANIVAAVARAQSSKANIQRIVDRISNVFVPIVLLIALGTAAYWYFAYDSALPVAQKLSLFLWHVNIPTTAMAAAAIHAAGVLIIACPCAMGLATPAALMAAANSAARRGILIRDAAALEKAGVITAIAFDKTGTLTEGRPQLVDMQVVKSNYSREELLQFAGSIGSGSQHPLSKALSTGANVITPANVQELRGKGMQGILHFNGEQLIIRLGSLEWLGQPANDFTTLQQSQGATVLGLEMNGEFAAFISLRDKIKASALKVTRTLKSRGIETYLITGDNEVTARAIATEAGIKPENVFARVTPEGKAAQVIELQKRGFKVCFVGDGINDAPALEQSDLGIAVSSASQIAAQSADIVLLRSEITALPEALELAAAALRTIKQNLFWAFFYNTAGIPLAALGLLSPIICAAAMGMSDLVVIGNSFRLFRFKAKTSEPV